MKDWWCPYGSSFYFYEWGSGWLFYFHAKWIQDEAVDHFPFYILFSGFPPIKGLFIWFSTIKDSSNDKVIPIQEKSDSEALSCTSLLLDYFYKIWIILLSSLILDSSWEKWENKGYCFEVLISDYPTVFHTLWLFIQRLLVFPLKNSPWMGPYRLER